MTTARDLRSWLMSAPRPTAVRLHLTDGAVHELACNQPWARLGESCAAMDAVTIYALDAQGKLLRVAKVADIADELEQLEEGPGSSSSSSSSSTGQATIQKDDSRAMLAVLDRFGTLLANAYQHATDTAFQKMVDVVTLQSNANVAMQRELMNARVEVRRLERDIIDEAIDKAEAAGDGDIMRQFVGAYFSGQAERFAQQATNAVAGGAAGAAGGKPNGKPPAPTPTPKGAA